MIKARGLTPLFTVVLGCAGCVGSNAPAPHFDVLIRAGEVYSGTLERGQVRDIGVSDGLIMTLDASATATADRVIDAQGQIVTPGFIDPHTHALSDLKDPERGANPAYLMQGVTTVIVGNDGYGLTDRRATLASFEMQGIGTNVGFFAGHGGIRKRVMKLADRAPTADELAVMSGQVRDAMEDGALGLSTGLYYAPGSFAHTQEVVTLATVAAQYGGVYDTHLRVESVQAPGLLSAVEEALEIGRQAKIPVHISHIKALGADSWGASAEVIDLITRARREGLRVTANQYPWRASGTRFSNALIPRWVMADSKAAMAQRLDDDARKTRIRQEMTVNLQQRGGADAMLISDPDSPWRGKTLADVAALKGQDVLDTAVALVLGGDPSIASFVMDPNDIRAFAAQPWVMTGSDGSRGHPRKYATYPKAYRDFVVDSNVMTLARFVQRSSAQVASELGLCDRGLLREGYRADIAVIDLDAFKPVATYEDAARLSTGVTHLLVNGEMAIDAGTVQATRAGQVIRRSPATCAND